MSALDDFLSKTNELGKPQAPVAPDLSAPPLPKARPAPPSQVAPQPAVPPAPAPTSLLDQFLSETSSLQEVPQEAAGGSLLDQFLAETEGEGGQNRLENLALGGQTPMGMGVDSPNTGAPTGVPGDKSLLQETGELFTTIGRGIGRGFNQAQAGNQASTVVTGVNDPVEAARGVAQQLREAAEYKKSQDVLAGQAEWDASTGVIGPLKAFFSNPEFAANMVSESLASSAIPIAGAAAGTLTAGPIGGMIGLGLGSAAQESANTFLSYFAEKKGVDISDEEQLAAAFSNPEWVKEARNYAGTRGAIVGAVDALTMRMAPKVGGYVASKLMKGAEGAATRSSIVGHAATGLAVESLGGGLGEAAAQLGTEGRITSVKDIIAEIAGEVVPGSAEFTMASLSGGGHTSSTPLSDQDILDFGGVPAEREVTPEVAEAEGRTLYGFEHKDGTVTFGKDYGEAESIAAEKGVRNGRLIAINPDELRLPDDVTTVAQNVKGLWVNEIVAPTPETKGKLERAVKLAQQPNKYEEAQALYTEAKNEGARFSDAAKVGIPMAYKGGDLKGKRVSFKQVDYAGLAVDPNAVAAGETIKPVRRGAYDFFGGKVQRLTSEYDLDLKKLAPGAIIPYAGTLRDVMKKYGKDLLLSLARQGGTTEEGLAEFDRELGAGAKTYIVGKLLKEKKVVLKMDPRLMEGTVEVVDPEAVKAAIVKKAKPGGSLLPSFENPGIFTQDLSKVAGTGKVKVDIKGLTPGLVHPDTRKTALASVDLMRTLYEKWKTPFDLKIEFGTAEDSHYSPSNHSIYIQVGPGAAGMTPAGIHGVIFHEFGHAISAMGLIQMDPGTRTRVYAAYRRFVETTSRLSEAEAMRRQAMQGRQTEWSSAERNNGYSFSFEEWFADQVARWAISNGRPIGFIAKVVRPIAKRLLEAAKAFAKFDPTNRGRAEPEIQRFLNELHSGQFKNDWNRTIQEWHDHETKLQNERDTAGQDLGPMTPMTQQSQDVRDLLAKMGIEKIEQQAQVMGLSLPPIKGLGAQIDRFNWMYKWFLSLPQVAEQNPQIAELQRYRELIQMAHLESQNIMVAASDRMREWSRLGKKQSQALGELLFELTQMSYLSPAEVAANVVRQPTAAELQAIVRRLGLTRESMVVYAGIRQDFETALGRHILELQRAALKITDPAAQQAQLAEINKMHQLLLKKPYFPMTRYGKWTLTVRNGNNLEYFETFESKRERDRAFRTANKNYPVGAGYVVQGGVLAEAARTLNGVPPQMLDMMATVLKLSKDQMDALEQLKFQLSPAQSFKKRFLRRNEVEGWSDNAQRNYAHYMFHHAKHHTRVRFADALRSQIAAIRSSVSGIPGVNDARLRIANFMEHHLDEFLNPKADMAGLRSAAAVWHLGLNAKSAVLNLTQLPLVTTPFLSSKFGDLSTLNAMRKAASDLNNYYRKDTLKRSSDPELRALAEAMDEGFINESQAAELAGLAEGGGLLSGFGGDATKKKWRQISALSMKMFEATEQFNRRVTFRAAWKLAQDNPNAPWLRDLQQKHALQYNRLVGRGWSHTDAVSFLAGKDTVVSTQFEYAKYARPRFMQGRKGAIFMFYLFTQNMLFMLGKNRSSVLPRYMLTMALMGGMMGLPGAEDADEIVRAVAALMGKDFDIENNARRIVVDVLDDSFAADYVMRGAARTSFGLPQLLDMAGVTWMPQVDMSRSIGFGKVLPFNPATLVSPGASAEKAMSDAVTEGAGAAFGIGLAAYKALTDSSTPWSDPKRWERALPTAARNVARSFRIGSQGEEVDARGVRVAKFDWRDPEQMAELIAMSLGFSSTRMAQEWDRRMATREVQIFWETRREMVTRSFYRAVKDNDAEGRAEAAQMLRNFNEEAPPSLKISAQGLRQSLKTRMQTRAMGNAGVEATKAERSVSQEMRQLFPNAAEVRKVEKLVQ